MAEEDTVAVLDKPAETVATEELTPDTETDVQVETETEGEDEQAPETFSAEQLEAARKEAADAVRAEAKEQAEAAQAQRQQAQVAQKYKEMGDAVLWEHLQKFARTGAVLATEKGHTPDEVARLVEPVHAKKLLDLARETLAPHIRREEFDSDTELVQATVAEMFPTWEPSRAVVEKFVTARHATDKRNAFKGLIEYVRAALEENEVPARVEARSKAEQEKKQKAAEVAKAQKAGAPGPSRVAGSTGSGSRHFTTMLQVDTALQNGEIDMPEMYRWLAKNKAGQLPDR